MNVSIAGTQNARSVLAAIGNWPEHLPDRQPKTPSSHRPALMCIRIRKKIVQSDQTIVGFHQRRWL